MARLAFTGHPSLLLRNMAAVMTGKFKPEQTLWRMPYAAAIAMGVAAHAAWVFSGRTPILNF
jgi:prepilin peptidase CpaA